MFNIIFFFSYQNVSGHKASTKPGPAAAEASEAKYIVNLRLMKLTGLYQILDPDTPKVCGRNPFRVAGAVAALYLFAVYALCASSLYSSLLRLGAPSAVPNSAFLFVATSFTLIKLYLVVRDADALWRFVDFSSVDFLSYGGQRRRRALADARSVSVAVTYGFALAWTAVSVGSALSPVIRSADAAAADGRTRRDNVLNLVYPVSDECYNHRFVAFYALETVALVCYVYLMLVYDCLVVSVAVVVAYQLKTIASSYADLGHASRSATLDGAESTIIKHIGFDSV